MDNTTNQELITPEETQSNADPSSTFQNQIEVGVTTSPLESPKPVINEKFYRCETRQCTKNAHGYGLYCENCRLAVGYPYLKPEHDKRRPKSLSNQNP